jgi:PAS domain S-box-containing protein
MSRARILIVEDEFIVAHDMRTTLERHGYDVCGMVSTGEEAIAVAERERPHCILMDMSIRGAMSGLEAARRIRAGAGDLPLQAGGSHRAVPGDREIGHRASGGGDGRRADSGTDLSSQEAVVAPLRNADADALLRSLISSLEEGFLVYDRDLRYRAWNHFMEQMTGLPAADVIGRRNVEVFPELRDHPVQVLLQRALAGETVTSEDTPFRVERTAREGWLTVR